MKSHNNILGGIILSLVIAGLPFPFNFSPLLTAFTLGAAFGLEMFCLGAVLTLLKLERKQ